MSEKPVKYLLNELQPGDTHFVKGTKAKTVMDHLYNMRSRYGVVADAVIRAVDSKSGVIIRREA